MNNDYTDLLTVEELCDLLKISQTAAYRLLASGKLKCFRLGRIWRIPRECVNEYIREQSFLPN
ncbi:MAG: helix-turn-helix domain-containing protein [Butyrivibrio sp.]|jgi:excisionase family DNA binding protein|nr:helix-turn-helix domain-containing protein [Butyrivibrio sp.]